MAIVPYLLGNKPTANGSPCILSATFNDTNRQIQSIIVTKDGEPSFRPTIRVLDSTTKDVIEEEIVPEGSPIIYDLSGLHHTVRIGDRGDIISPYDLVFG